MAISEEGSHTAVNEAEKAVHSTTDRMARAAHQAIDTLSNYGTQTQERLRDTGLRANARTRQLADQVFDYVAAHPFATLGIAVAAGFALGAIARRRNQEGG